MTAETWSSSVTPSSTIHPVGASRPLTVLLSRVVVVLTTPPTVPSRSPIRSACAGAALPVNAAIQSAVTDAPATSRVPNRRFTMRSSVSRCLTAHRSKHPDGYNTWQRNHQELRRSGERVRLTLRAGLAGLDSAGQHVVPELEDQRGHHGQEDTPHEPAPLPDRRVGAEPGAGHVAGTHREPELPHRRALRDEHEERTEVGPQVDDAR